MDFDKALRFSRYATRVLDAYPAERAWLQASIDSCFCWEVETLAVGRAQAARDATGLAAALRLLRRRAFLHTMVRDLTGRAPLVEVCGMMTELAQRAVSAALDVHSAILCAQHGTPRDKDGVAQTLVVLGMGKLGGGELNVSSDVDLIFLYPSEGDTDGGRSLSNREFFDRLGRRLIAALHEPTADGYVFRVDMRLRPYGESGPLTLSFAALEQYLIAQGRAWERYAWLKARPLTGERHAELAAIIEPFVFRKYLDYDAYEGLRDIHRQIREQGARKDLASNIKLGPGGIRELEFTVQALQLVRGGREPGLRVRGTLPALEAIGVRKLLPDVAVAELRGAYEFLRALEHRLQYRDDQQTQSLPSSADECAALAGAMDEDDVAALVARLERHRNAVEGQFNQVFGDGDARPVLDSNAREAAAPPSAFDALWREALSPDVAIASLREAGFDDPQAALTMLDRVRKSRRYAELPVLSRQRFDALIPRVLEAASEERESLAGAQAVFTRLLLLLETVSRRSSYLALVIEHPPLLPRLAHFMSASAWAADYLTQHPILLDELLDARVLLTEPDPQTWAGELERLLAERIGDTERQMDALRHFHHAQTFRLLAQDLAGMLTVERLADHLSALADTILAATVKELWGQIAGRDAPPARFAVIGYGKLGGKELSYLSDLDLVFIYDDPADHAAERYARLAQRIVLWLTSATAAGTLYDVDLRLRPDGDAGFIASSAVAFWRYQREKAWTWEHQALTRARFVAGDAELGAAFETERVAILRLPRAVDKLREDVIDMRRRMYAGHRNNTELFDVKHDAGGMVDVEFAVQFLVLAHAHRDAELTRNAGNIALLLLASRLGLISPERAEKAASAYRENRRRQHQLRLSGARHARVAAESVADDRETVLALWLEVFGSPWT